MGYNSECMAILLKDPPSVTLLKELLQRAKVQAPHTLFSSLQECSSVMENIPHLYKRMYKLRGEHNNTHKRQTQILTLLINNIHKTNILTMSSFPYASMPTVIMKVLKGFGLQ